MTRFLEGHGLLRQAAAIAKTFRIDPVMVLNSSELEWRVRTAAHNVIVTEEKKANASSRSSRPSRGRK